MGYGLWRHTPSPFGYSPQLRGRVAVHGLRPESAVNYQLLHRSTRRKLRRKNLQLGVANCQLSFIS